MDDLRKGGHDSAEHFQHVQHRSWWSPQVCGLFVDDLKHACLIDVQEATEKPIGVESFGSVRQQCALREITEVGRDDRLGMTMHRSGGNVPIFWVVRHGWNQRFIANDRSFRKRRRHRVDETLRARIVDASRFDEIPSRFFEDFRGPIHAAKPFSGCA